MISTGAVLAASRLTYYGATMFVFGVCGFTVMLAPQRLAADIWFRLRSAAGLAIVLIVVATAAWLPPEAADIGGDWQSAFDPDTLSGILFNTSIGPVWIARAGLSVLLAVVFLMWKHRNADRGLFVVSGMLLGVLALSGHAAMDENLLGVLHKANDALHVLTAGAWIGSLAALLPCLDALNEPVLRRDAAAALRRFSTAGHFAVAILLATGAANTYLVLGKWPVHWSSPYQLLLCVKIVLVAVMVAVALFNRYVLVPKISLRGDAAVRAIWRRTVAELVLAFGVLTLVAVFGLLDPV